MARKPVQLQFRGGKGPRQRVWDLIRAKRERFELLDICPGDIPVDTARTYLKSLEAAKIVEQQGDRSGPLANRSIKIYRLVDDRGLEAPRVRKDGSPVTQGLAQEQMWRTLRMHKGDINTRELAAHASTRAVPVDAGAALDYLCNLAKSGYLACTVETQRKPRGITTQARYRLVRDTGPRAPMVCKANVIYDPNTDQTHPVQRVTEEDAIYGR